MNTEDLEKIALIDQVFKSMTLDDIKVLFSSDLLVGKLKAHDNSTGVLVGTLQELSILRMEIATLRAELTSQKIDFAAALRVMNTLSLPTPPLYSPELQTLKSKYGVY
jgi:hypothetical protein